MVTSNIILFHRGGNWLFVCYPRKLEQSTIEGKPLKISHLPADSLFSCLGLQPHEKTKIEDKIVKAHMTDTLNK